MKKYVITIISAIMLLGTTAYANDMSTVDEALLERGYPQNVLERMCDENKLEIYNNEDLHYGGATMVQYWEETGESRIVDMDNPVSTYGQIPSADFTMMLTPSGKTTNGKLEYIDFVFDYEWDKIPINRYQDPITVGFDYNGLNYRLNYDIFRKVDKYTYTDNTMSTKTATHSDEPAAAEKSRYGVNWYADLKGGVVHSLYGYGKFRVNGSTPTASGEMDVNFMYAHAKSAIGVTIPVPKVPGAALSITSGASTCDSMGDAMLIKWANGKITSY